MTKLIEHAKYYIEESIKDSKEKLLDIDKFFKNRDILVNKIEKLDQTKRKKLLSKLDNLNKLEKELLETYMSSFIINLEKISGEKSVKIYKATKKNL